MRRAVDSVVAEYRVPRRPLRSVLGLVRKKPLGTAAFLVVASVVLVAIFADLVATHDPTALDSFAVFKAPSAQHWLGTDNLGRDVFSRIVYGSRVSLVVGFSAMAVASLAGGILGLLSGYVMGTVDLLSQRLVDILQALPTLVMAMAVVAALGPSMPNVIIAIALVNIPTSVRVMRGSAIAIRDSDYITAAKVIGAPGLRIALRHVLPNCLAPFIIIVTAKLAAIILTEAALSFLGLGVMEPTPSWGGMLARFGAAYASQTPWVVISPGVAISVTVIAFNLFGDAIRDILDPRLRGT